MRKFPFLFLAFVALVVLGCQGQQLPQDQAAAVDRIEVTNTISVSVNNGSPSNQPTTQPASVSTVSITASPDVKKVGAATQGQTATGGSAGQTQDIKPSTSIPVNVAPGAGGLLNK